MSERSDVGRCLTSMRNHSVRGGQLLNYFVVRFTTTIFSDEKIIYQDFGFVTFGRVNNK